MKYGIYTLMAPMIFLMTWKHSLGSCTSALDSLVAEDYLAAQINTILYGLCKSESAVTSNNKEIV
jgi:TetR/AcrR family transcriptional regulator